MKSGMVILMDALGAKNYSEKRIKEFLSSRRSLNDLIKQQAKEVKAEAKSISLKPIIYTFGDTLIIVAELDKNEKDRIKQIIAMLIIIQNHLFSSMHHGILFRGAFSFGEYIDDEDSNTVMGSAVSDAASWYEKAEWFGMAATPAASYFIEYALKKYNLDFGPKFILPYPVPMKSGTNLDLYTVSWPGRFYQEKDTRPELDYLELISKLEIKAGTENKYVNSHKYFHYVTEKILSQPSQKNG